MYTRLHIIFCQSGHYCYSGVWTVRSPKRRTFVAMEKSEFVEGKVDWKGRQAIRNKHGGMRTGLLVFVTFGFENMATLALAVNLVTYFISVMHLEIAEAANSVTNYLGTSYILSIPVAILADAYLGRVKSVLISGFLEFLGLALLTVQAHYPKLRPAPCTVFDPNSRCEKLKGGNEAFLFFGLYLIALGTAGIKASLPAHGADQFDETEPREVKQMSSYFNFLMMASCLGSAVSLTLIVWIQDNRGWDWGFGIGTIALVLGLVIFVAGLPVYRINVVKGSSAVIEIIQVYVAAIRNRNLPLPEDPSELYETDKDKEASVLAEFLSHRDVFRFLDKAAIERTPAGQLERPEAPNQWKLCRVTQVENAKIILGMVPVFCCTIIMTLCLAQLQTFSVQQGRTMDARLTDSFHIPPASLPIFPLIFMIISVPVYDKLFVPLARNITGHPTGITHLQRIGVGLVLSCISMAVAAIMELKRKRVARDHNLLDANPDVTPLPISVFWLSFQYFIFGIADLFTYVGLLEFFYSEAPKGIKSISTCFLWSSMALGYYGSSIVIDIVNRATKGITKSGGWLAGNNINRNHLNLFYWLLSMLCFFNFCIYLFVAKRYKYRPQNPPASDDESRAYSI